MLCQSQQRFDNWFVVQDFSDLVAAKAAQQKRKAAERKEKGKKKDSFKF